MITLDYSLDERKAIIASSVTQILKALGENPERDGLARTPDRVADALIEMAGGALDGTKVETILGTTFENGDYDEMVIVEDIPVRSVCEHHLLAFTGKAIVAYIPDGNRIVGLSKFARLVDHFSRRPQVQERLTTQIATAVNDALKPRGVGVVIKAEHLCMSLRGIKCSGRTTTSCMLGSMHDDAKTRAELLALVRL